MDAPEAREPMTAPRIGRPDGVNVVGYVRAEVGVGEAARLLVAALKAAEIPYSVLPSTAVPSRQKNRFDDWGSGTQDFATNIICVNAASLGAFVNEFGTEFLEGRHNIGLWWWEVDEFPREMADAAMLLDEIWVGSRHAHDAIAPVVPRPVLVFPLPIVAPTAPPLTRAELGLPEGFIFLFTFDFNSVVERKNPAGLIRAFTRAFQPGEGPVLVLKSVNGEQHPEALQRLRALAEGRPDIQLVDAYVDADVLHAMLASCDAYVSLHRSEGFGIGLGEAMALGKPVIATAYGGNLEFMNEANSYLVGYELTTVPPGCEPYPTTARWADPDLAEAASSMRKVWEDPDDARAKGERARLDIVARHAPRTRARFVRRRLEAVRRQPLLSAAAPPDRSAVIQLRVTDTEADVAAFALSSDGRGGGVTAALRGILYRLLFPVLHRQSEYNRKLGQATTELRAARLRHEDELQELAARVDRLEGDGS